MACTNFSVSALATCAMSNAAAFGIAASPLTVICLEIQNDVCQFAKRSLEATFGFVVLRCPAMLREIRSLAQRVGPSILLSDAEFVSKLPPTSIRELWGSQRLQILLVLDPRDNEQCAVPYIREGCSGMLHLDDPPELCRKAIRQVSAGELWVSRKIASDVLREIIWPESDPLRKLTPREAEILQMIGLGYDNKDIAGQLFISKETVRWHVRSLYSKLGVSDRASARQFWHRIQRDRST
jgi:DNA-binding NarL/FixJ family response regulator